MRNWNDKIISVFPVSPLVTSLPMRNWNCETVALRDLFPAVTSLPMRNWNYARRIFICPAIGLPAYLWGIETILVLFFYGATNVTSLPMRNWNSSFRNYTYHDCYVLPAYLWGIETRSGWTHVLSPHPVTSLPMRIETLHVLRSNTVRRLPAYLWGIETGSVVHRIK